MKITENLPENFIGQLEFISIEWDKPIWKFQIKEPVKNIPIFVFLFQLLWDLYKDEKDVNIEAVIDLIATHREATWKEESDKKIEEIFGKEFTIKLMNT